ncbi:MAG: sugar kinase [Bacteroidia bacterium]|nr:sugar kinase [Bacteroidia bacterium]
MSKSLLVIGTVAFDNLETPFGKEDMVVGGAATYASLAASYFRNNTKIVSVVGEDFPQSFLDTFRAKGIDIEGIQIKKGEKSFFWAGKYHMDMNTRDTLDTQLNVLATFDPVVPASYQNADYLLLGNLMPKLQKRVLEQMQHRPKLVVMDTMNFWMETAWDDLIDMLGRIDVLTINDEEARILSKEYSLVKAAKKIMAMGPKYLIIKKGENGALLFHKNEVFYAPALPLEEVFDPTGAGDSFAGGFIGYLAKTDNISFENMKRAIIYGSALASFTVEKFGTRRLLEISDAEVEERLQDFVDLVQFDIILEENNA